MLIGVQWYYATHGNGIEFFPDIEPEYASVLVHARGNLSIYEQDNERYESYEEAEKIYEFLKKGYKGYDYDICLVPVGSIAYRTEFILNKLNTLF